MILFWRIRYLDRSDRKFKDRDLYLDTDSLDPQSKAAVELCYELNESGSNRDMLKFRHLFLERSLTTDEKLGLCHDRGFGTVYFLREYFEDEDGKEVMDNEIAQILSGSPNAVAIPSWAEQHDIDYILAPQAPIDVKKIAASDDDLKVLGYFVRDLRELEKSALSKNGPGRLSSTMGSEPVLLTAISDEEIRSFVTIFRRLYMTGEPASFLKVVELFVQLAGDYPLVRWVAGVARQYEQEMQQKPGFAPFDDRDKWVFTRKRLIDVFIYTRYAHQPNDDRIRQFNECLDSVGKQRQKLTWLFLTEMWLTSAHFLNGGRVIARVYDAYCELWGKRPQLLDSIANEIPGLAQLETKENKRQRVFRAKAEALAIQLWETNGRPEGGAAKFLKEAQDSLKAALT